MKTKWTKPIPTTNGWYWIRYTGKNGKIICPCYVCHLKIGVVVRTAKNDTFSDGDRTAFGFDNARFGPAIPLPD